MKEDVVAQWWLEHSLSYTDEPSSIPGKGKNQDIGHSSVDWAVNGYLIL